MPRRGAPRDQSKPGTARLRAINEAVKEAADVIQENIAAKGAGRPSKYHPGFVHIAANTALAGSTNHQLSEMFGVWGQTIDDWMKTHPPFSEAIKRGRALTDDIVEQSLVHRARGYTHRAEKIFQYEGGIVRAEYDEHYPPDATSMIFWLKNRRPDQWRDQRDPPGSTPEEAARIIRESAGDIEAASGGKKKK